MKVEYDLESLDPFFQTFPAEEKALLQETLMYFKALMHTATPKSLRYQATEYLPTGAMRPVYYKAFFYAHISIFVHFTCDRAQQLILVQQITYHYK